MKISVSLPAEDVQFLDAHGSNRSAAVHEAIEALRRSRLADDYTAAFAEFEESGDAELWDVASGDGVTA